ncbi:MAG: Fe2+ transport system protein FeoA [Rickettsiales bacterium]|jgi:Fe2+ transport system protein FeoA
MKNLFAANINQDLVISALEESSNDNHQLMVMNFGVGSKVRILQKYRDAVIIAKDNMRLVLSSDIASKIFCH